MARKALWERSLRKPKYPVRKVNRCSLCGRPRGFIRQFGICRLCFRELASRGEIVGVRKASF
ncbi:MAG: type Z 30S ribosomal protein S14 [Candidatus Dadabacteria bacterium]|nr:type Z 30S ribosomal protein S14 [Candidatus Dadabacteria bacterium]MCY4042676.1 type Z 30S ribosomal protein S14 [Candidatus Dadabacteria bacterium]MCY4047420.1 type Z 30S ribosomal protein S14 [Candidatus Dadabacteria bacterium]